jgi:hypothetical protein
MAFGRLSNTSFRCAARDGSWFSSRLGERVPCSGAGEGELLNAGGYSEAQTLVSVLKQCGEDLTRENLTRPLANTVALMGRAPSVQLYCRWVLQV